MCSDPLAKQIMKLNPRDLEAVLHGVIRALAKARVFGATVTGTADDTDVEATQRRLWSSHPEGADRRSVRPDARDRGDDLRLKGAIIKRCGDQDAAGRQRGED
jgi:hypothetical protein